MKLLFVESFKKIDKKFAYVILFDFIFYIALALAILLFSKLLAWSFGSFLQIPGKLLAMSKMSDLAQIDAGMAGASTLLNQFKSKLALSFISFWVLTVAVFTVFKGVVWAFVSKQKINKKFLLQFLKLNLWWIGIITLIGLIIFWLTKPAATGFSVLLLSALALYFTPVFYSIFDPRKDIKELFTKLWHVGVERFYYFILPYALSCALLFVCLGVLGLVMLSIIPDAAIFVLFAFFVVWQSWIKYYIYSVARSIK